MLHYQTLEQELGLFKMFEIEDTSIPNKHRQLLGLTATAILHGCYCANFHKAKSEMFDVSEEEIEEAVLLSKAKVEL